MADVNHYAIAEQLVGESVQGAGTMSGREVSKAQVHATLAVAEILRGLSAELAMIRQAAQVLPARPADSGPPGQAGGADG